MVIMSAAGPESAVSVGSVRRRLRSVLITGFALTVPLLVTVMLLVFVVNFILQAIGPVVAFVNDAFGIGRNVDELTMELLAVATFVALVFLVGLVAEFRQGDGLERVFDATMARIPGVGSVYTSFNEMTQLLLSNDTQSFQEVKLVEFPVEGSYAMAFVTARAPEVVEDATDTDGMTTLFLPMAPNPVMGGHVVHVSNDRVYDVDLTVEEGIRSIVTSGVATGESTTVERDGKLVDLAAIRDQALDGVEEVTTHARTFAGGDGGDATDRESAQHYLITDQLADEPTDERDDAGRTDGDGGDQSADGVDVEGDPATDDSKARGDDPSTGDGT